MKISVYITQRPNMFTVNENMYHLIGTGELKEMYTSPSFKSYGKLTLFYPERFLNINEQRRLIDRAKDSGYDDLEIVTHSVYIAQVVHSDNIKILVGEIPDNDEFFQTNNINGMPDDSGLGIIGGEIV